MTVGVHPSKIGIKEVHRQKYWPRTTSVEDVLSGLLVSGDGFVLNYFSLGHMFCRAKLATSHIIDKMQ